MTIQEQIEQLQTFCLVNRFLYYVKAVPVIEDKTYDTKEKQLRDLVEQHPEIFEKSRYYNICPSQTIGSSNSWDYPKEIIQQALLLKVN